MDILPTAKHRSHGQMPVPRTIQFGHLLNRIARKRILAVALTGVVAFAAGAAFTAVRTPVAKSHDEYSYLLAADTFAQGRLTNPTHPMWKHFETFHVIQQPSYASKYQPGQGLVLALGQVLGGHPIVGAWIATALAAAAMCWMLQGWVPPRWALVGGLLIALHYSIQARWALSYWGGSLPMAGGALMFGALPRLLRRPRAGNAVLFALGAILLAATRPFEGFVIGACAATALLAGLARRRWKLATVVPQIVVPAVALLGIGLAGLGYYNWRVTGDPLRMPYQVHEETYGFSPLFLWQSKKDMPEYRHPVMQELHTGWAIQEYQRQQSLGGFLQSQGQRVAQLWQFYLGGVLTIPLVMLPAMLARPRLVAIWVALVVAYLAEMAVPWTFPHYFAPAAPLLFLAVVEGFRHLRLATRNGPAWIRLAVPALVGVHLLTLPLLLLKYARWEPAGWAWQRVALADRLQSSPGEHLVLVRYAHDHIGHAEWVYNRADIDAAKVVWAREMGPEDDKALLDYFRDRHVWLVEPDSEQPALIPYADLARLPPTDRTEASAGASPRDEGPVVVQRVDATSRLVDRGD